MWDPGFLARRVAFLENHPSCGFVYSGDRQVDQHGRRIASERTASLQSQNVADVLADGVYSPHEYIASLYRHKLGGIHTAIDLQPRRDVSPVRTGGGGACVRRDISVPVLGRGALSPDGVAVPDRVYGDQGRDPADSPSEHHQRTQLRRRVLAAVPRLPRALVPPRASRPPASPPVPPDRCGRSHHGLARRLGARRPAPMRASLDQRAAAQSELDRQASVRGRRRRARPRPAGPRPARPSPGSPTRRSGDLSYEQ